MVKKLIQVCKDIDWALDSKTKCDCLHDISPHVTFFYFHHSNLTSLFGIFNIKSLCNAKFTVDVTPFFAFFVLIFMSAHGNMKILFSS